MPEAIFNRSHFQSFVQGGAMFSNRSLGLRSLSLLFLLSLVILSFWGWLFIWEQDFFFQGIAFQRYLIYNEFLLIGILFGLSAKHCVDGPHHEFVSAVRRSSRQAILGLFGIFIVAFA